MILSFSNMLALMISICLAFLPITSIAAPSVEGIQVFHKNFHLDEERTQSLSDDIDRYDNADNMWEVLRSEFTLPHYEENAQVQEQIRWFLNNRDFLQRSAARAAPYLYYISQQVRKRHLPAEIVLLPMIESAYNPFVYSSVGAGGIWQMMPDTATGYGVKQNWWYDGRRDVIASTKAALDYLVYLGGFFDGNWLLAIAAYNTGEGNVLAAIRKNVRDGRNTDFWSLPVAQQTKDYVPRLLALACIIANAEKYNIEFPSVGNAPYLAQVDIGGQIDLKHAAYLAGLSLKELKQLNPGYNHTTTDPGGPFKLVLPIQNVKQFTENLMWSSPTNERVRWNQYKVKSGDTLVAIARKFKTTPSIVQRMNSLSSNAVKPGTTIILPERKTEISRDIVASEKMYARFTPKRKKYAAPPELVAHNGKYELKPGDTLYMVRRGDNLDKIANKFHISKKTLMAANNLKSLRSLAVGAQLIIPTHRNKKEEYQLAPGDTIYMVRNGDSMDKIADKFNTTSPAIRLANLMPDNDIHPGDRLIIPTHA